jgi:penicillin amidase
MLWEWDIVHGSRLHHALGDAWPWDQLLSRDLNPDGWADTANASPGGLPCVGAMCMGGDLFRAKAVYSYRQILDASDLSTLWFALLPGQSDHPFHPHYDDLMDEWLAGEFVQLRLAPTPDAVQGTESVLILKPSKRSVMNSRISAISGPRSPKRKPARMASRWLCICD